jgi:squalene-hopene/tetraprenyl-beta-curcumene cyclase
MDTYPGQSSAAPQLRLGKLQDLSGRVLAAMRRAQDYLFGTQHAEGYWCGELEADTTLESDYIMVHHLLGTGNDRKLRKAAATILENQLEDGGWPIYDGGPSNVSATVKAYFALKLEGYSADHPALTKARACINALGGITAINTYTKLYLCFFGQYDYRAVPAIPPEMVLFPTWFWFNLYEISAWSRAILVPLAIAYAKKPFHKIKSEQGVQELFPGGNMLECNLHLKWDEKIVSWRNFFLVVNKFIHFCEMVHIRPLRSLALNRAEKWMLERMEMSDGLGAIYPGILNSIIALRCLGYSLDDPQVIRVLDEFDALGIEEGDTFRMQPCKSPVWDTVYAMFALGESGVAPGDPRLVKAADWVLKKQVTHKGDWSVKVPKVDPAGWYFEFNNEFYPDVDDSAMVNLALARVEHWDESYQHKSVKRAIDWIVAMQCRNGGWASFDKDNTKMVFQYIPFADHNAMLDPPTVDITGRVLEMLATYGYTLDHPVVKKAIEFVRSEQEADGSWFGRWGVNYIYGTMLVLRGLETIGVDNHDPMVQQAAEWLRMWQNGDGGWGETLASYDDPSLRGQGQSTASQTAWAVMGLLAAGDLRSDCVARGVQWLLQHQNEEGTWDDDSFTGTGFPRVFYLKYHMYPEYFPLIALATYQKKQGIGDSRPGLRAVNG